MSVSMDSSTSRSILSTLLPYSLGFMAGIFVFKFQPLMMFHSQQFVKSIKSQISKNLNEDDSAENDSDDDSEQETSSIKDSLLTEARKMVLVVRQDLKMGKGKIAAQCCHGAVGAFKLAQRHTPHNLYYWEHLGQAKVCVKVDSEEELLDIKRKAEAHNLLTCIVTDAGRTQIAPNSKTVLAIGPAPLDSFEDITGHLKLM